MKNVKVPHGSIYGSSFFFATYKGYLPINADFDQIIFYAI